jgi:hypothetical protein
VRNFAENENRPREIEVYFCLRGEVLWRVNLFFNAAQVFKAGVIDLPNSLASRAFVG